MNEYVRKYVLKTQGESGQHAVQGDEVMAWMRSSHPGNYVRQTQKCTLNR